MQDEGGSKMKVTSEFGLLKCYIFELLYLWIGRSMNCYICELQNLWIAISNPVEWVNG
jgi:hypothetical protein